MTKARQKFNKQFTDGKGNWKGVVTPQMFGDFLDGELEGVREKCEEVAWEKANRIIEEAEWSLKSGKWEGVKITYGAILKAIRKLEL